MEVTKLWAENKALVIKVALIVFVGLLVIKFFDVVFFGAFLVALVVAAVLGWNHLSKKHGGAEGVWKALLKELGIGS